LAAGLLSPVATLILVLVTLFGALPVYQRVAAASPHGQGSIAMLEKLFPRWGGKVFILVLLGFATTDFIITMTPSAADAAAHFRPEPVRALTPEESNGCDSDSAGAVGNGVPEGVPGSDWDRDNPGWAVPRSESDCDVRGSLGSTRPPSSDTSVAQCTLGPARRQCSGHGGTLIGLVSEACAWLSGFETRVAVMPLIEANGDGERIRNAHKLLKTATFIMSVFLLATSFATTLVIEPDTSKEGGEANGRALAYIGHKYLGNAFGTVYDFSTILILAFAGASPMAGLLNLIPRYLPRFGMAPEWARGSRPLVLVFLSIALTVTLLFHAMSMRREERTRPAY